MIPTGGARAVVVIIIIVYKVSNHTRFIAADGRTMGYDSEGKMIEFGEFPTLETKRLILRRMTMDDAEFYLKHFSDPTIVALSAYEAPKDIEAARQELREYCVDIFTLNAGIRWGITLKDAPELIGTCGFYKWIKHAYHAEIGYDLAPEFRRKGIMKEALTAMIDYLFGTVGLNRIQALMDPGNLASIKLVESLGFREEGVLREFTRFRGKFLNDAVYSVLASEWKDR